MIPANGFMRTDFVFVDQPSHTFFLDIDNNVSFGYTDGREAVKQAIYLVLETERYQHAIFSRNYGAELRDLIGQPIDYVLPELRRRITEALLQDTRIRQVEDFEFEVKKGVVTAAFTAMTVFGPIQFEKAVAV